MILLPFENCKDRLTVSINIECEALRNRDSRFPIGVFFYQVEYEIQEAACATTAVNVFDFGDDRTIPDFSLGITLLELLQVCPVCGAFLSIQQTCLGKEECADAKTCDTAARTIESLNVRYRLCINPHAFGEVAVNRRNNQQVCLINILQQPVHLDDVFTIVGGNVFSQSNILYLEPWLLPRTHEEIIRRLERAIRWSYGLYHASFRGKNCDQHSHANFG